MQNVRPVVEHAAQAVAAEIAHHAAALALGIGLDRRADIAGGGARLDRGHAAHQRVIGDLEQALGGAGNLADRVHAARIAVPAIDDQRHVDIEDVAFFERAGARDAVTDHVIERGADRFGEAPIIERGGDGAMIHGELEHELVERLGGDAGLDLIDQEIEHLGHEPARLGHAGEGVGAVKLDLGVARLGAGKFEIGHGKRL